MIESGLVTGLAKASLAELVAIYDAREESALADDPNTCAAIAQRALSLGEPLLAYDACRFALQAQPAHHRLRQIQGLALARCGALEQAYQALEGLYREGSRDDETLGILARVHKDRWQQASDSAAALESLSRCLDLYLEAYRGGGGYWSGINAATLALASGNKELSAELANRVLVQCLESAKVFGSADLWLCATIGEAELLLGRADEAQSWYARALNAGAGHGDRASIRRNARLVLAGEGRDLAWLETVLPGPVIAAFAGHMPDEENRSPPRFPEARSDQAGKVLKARLESANVQIGYASAASGSDILFHESMLDLGRETHVVLPEPPERFARASVLRGNSTWFERFQKVLSRAASVVVHSKSASGDIGYTYNNWMILGLARLRARQVEGHVQAYALWDGKTGPQGGTSSAVDDWQTFGEEVDWISPLSVPSSDWQRTEFSSKRRQIVRAVGSQRIVSMLFADAVGFSKLADDCIPGFVEHFLGSVARVLNCQIEPALTRNTWGDGLYFSFENPRSAGLFALDLCDTIRSTDWTAYGLPATLSLRVALHCGPAHEVIDPVIGQRNFTGAHVSRAARIEPITPPGSVYSSQSFAALCECEGVKEFACEYVGRMPLAKKYGEYPTFSVRRRG